MNHKETLAAIKALPHMTAIKTDDGEYRVTYTLEAICLAQPTWLSKRVKSHAEACAYYTEDREDALGTAKALSAHMDGIMARKKAAEAPQQTLYFCKARYRSAEGREADWSITVGATSPEAAKEDAKHWLDRERPGHTLMSMTAHIDISDPSYLEETERTKRQAYAEAYSAGDINVGKITGQYPNAPATGAKP